VICHLFWTKLREGCPCANRWMETATDIARRIGFVFQEHSSPFPYSVIDVVSMGRAPHLRLFSAPTRKDLQIAEEALDMVGMHHLKDKLYTQISGGERQLVLIARTIALQPDVILLDEPTSHLDLKNQTLILRMINKLARQGLSVMMSSHLPNHALLYSSKLARDFVVSDCFADHGYKPLRAN
jgi:iron complex transport system ATP-binding protein